MSSSPFLGPNPGLEPSGWVAASTRRASSSARVECPWGRQSALRTDKDYGAAENQHPPSWSMYRWSSIPGAASLAQALHTAVLPCQPASLPCRALPCAWPRPRGSHHDDAVIRHPRSVLLGPSRRVPDGAGSCSCSCSCSCQGENTLLPCQSSAFFNSTFCCNHARPVSKKAAAIIRTSACLPGLLGLGTQSRNKT